MKSSLPDVVATDDLADLLGVDARTIRNLASRGVITKADRGKFALRDAIRAVVADAKRARRVGPEEVERARLTMAKAAAAELKLRREADNLLPLDEALAVVSEYVGLVIVALDGFPARVTRDLAMRARIQDEIDKMRQSIAAECGKKARELNLGKGPNVDVQSQKAR